jgi:pyrroloquinoline quinone biosynthesis protein B
MLREGKQLPLYCTAPVWRELNHALPLVPVLSHYCGVHWHELTVDGGLQVPAIAGIRFTPLALSSKAPPYSDHRAHPHTGDNIGLLIEDVATDASAFYAPGLGAVDPQVEAALRQADCVLVDGTFWHADEMIALGLSSKTAADMGHLPQSGEGGMIAVLDGVTARRKVLIHINNTNPILDEDSEQRALLARHGIEVAFDGMEITL